MAQEAIYIQIILDEMGHKQPPTPLQTDNAMVDAVINGKITPKCTKAMDMASAGSTTKNAKNNSDFIGDQATQIKQIIGQNITYQAITSICGKNF